MYLLTKFYGMCKGVSVVIAMRKLRNPMLFMLLLFPALTAAQQLSTVVLDNGIIQREIDCSNGHITGKSFLLLNGNTPFINEQSSEFSIRLDDVTLTGKDNWSNISLRDTVDATGGKGVILSFRHPEKELTLELIYLLYPNLPVVYKTLRLTNTGNNDIKAEAIDVENLHISWKPTDSCIMRQYARYQWLGPYLGNWDDPLLIIHDHIKSCGMFIGNEAIGVMKRTSVFLDGRTVTAGVTHPDQPYGFRKWLHPGETWTCPWVFTAVYNNSPDWSKTLNTVIPDFVRRHANMRIEQLPKKPLFVYNTWIPFFRDINEKQIYELAKAASECGVEEFIIDDGWQINIDDPEGKHGLHGDWEVDKKKFPNGLRPVFDYIKSLGMKPGLWVTLAYADLSSRVYKEHPEYFVRTKDGEKANLHTTWDTKSLTACMATGWYGHIKQSILRLVKEHGLAYVKLDLAIVASAYIYDTQHAGCYATDHPYHKDHAESFTIIYERCMELFDELHREAPELFIDCTFETAGKLQLMDYGIAKYAEGNWLSNVEQTSHVGPLRVRQLGWGRTPALPATSLVIGNLQMDAENYQVCYKSLAGTLPIMLGDPRKLTSQERQWYKTWSGWLKTVEERHAFMSFRQDLLGFGEPAEGRWDGFCRLNTETNSGGLVGVFRHGAAEDSRTVTIPWLDASKTYIVKQGASGKTVATQTGKELSEKGFLVKLTNLYDGELFEIVTK